MDFEIKWDAAGNTDIRNNKESASILADTMEDLFPLKNGARILEIGGGNGVFASIATERGYDVTVLDCNESLLSDLPASVSSIAADWLEIEESDPSLADKYDLIISNFSTAVQTSDTLRKMNHTSSQWCMVNRILMYREPMMDRFARALELEEKPVYPNLKQDYIDFNNNSVIVGHRADVHFTDYHWETMRTPQDAANRFLSLYYSGKEIPEGMQEKALAVAEKMSDNGMISDPVKVHLAHLHWNVNYI